MNRGRGDYTGRARALGREPKKGNSEQRRAAEREREQRWLAAE